ncbi:hypothetical protein [Breznakiella homolactica]|uniref:Uncharacterized protein n=1 Tax=Breznakiella homolactica TaxID=2798577 RepID=A0A7T7XRJ0_9SPIR|nr:hypothetical protein [Breznakiella homolactica]QQO11122.1 hypothetical protein JFL75_09455 [Breznakiella homolactica]
MKAVRIIIASLILFCSMAPLFAQTTEISPENESEYFYVSVPVEKVYPYRKGYIVLYRKGVNDMARAYLPIEWFEGTAGKADLIRLGPGKSWPYLTVYYKDGEFSHLRLYVRREMNHETWGNVPLQVNLDDRFEGIDDLRLEF